MMKNIYFTLIAAFIFIGCASDTPQAMITKVREVSYPEGITVSIYDENLKRDIVLSDTRMVYGRNANQVQFIIRNTSKDKIYRVALNGEWTDKRGSIISTYPDTRKITLQPRASKRLILKAPNYKGKNVLINIECAGNCMTKIKK
jgi:uncharacterized protein YcfL